MNTLSIIGGFLSTILLIVMAIFILIKDWKDQVNRYYLFLNLSALGILSTMFITYAFPDMFDLAKVNRITQTSTILLFASLLTMSLVFPKEKKKFPLIITLIILMPAFFIGGVILLTDITITKAYFKNGVLVREYREIHNIYAYDIYAVVGFIYLLSGAINFIRKYVQTKVDVYKLQMRYVFVGGSVSIFIGGIVSIILPRFFNYSDLYVIGPTGVTFFMTFSLFYSVIAYHLMDITTVIHKTVMYSIISMLIILPIYGILELYDRNFWNFNEVPFYIIAVFIVVIFILFSVFIQPFIDKIFKRKQYEFGNVVDTFIRNVGEIKKLSDIIQKTVDILYESLNLKHAFFVMFNDNSRKYELVYYKSGKKQVDLIPVDRSSSTIRWFVRNQDLLHLGRIYTDDKSFAEIRDEIANFYVENDVQIILPIYHERRLLGLLCMGSKESLSGFTPDEVEKLKYFQSKSNDFLSTALIYEKAMKEQFTARTLDLSSNILASTIPTSLPNINNIKFGAFIIPKYAEGSDYFDFIRPGEHGVGVIATDISGVGINSALYSVLLRSAFQSSMNDAPSTFTVMQNINRVLYKYSKVKGELITAYYLYIDLKSMRLMYTNAGYPALEVFRVEKSNFDSLDTEGIPLGYDIETTYGIGRTDLQRGDIGILYSKTLTNSKNQKGEEFGLLRLRSIVMENRARSASEISELIKNSIENFMGLSSYDSDVLVIVFKII